MTAPSPPPRVAPPIAYSTSERVLLTGVPAENRSDLLRLLRSPDQVIRNMALVLILLDRDAQTRGR